VNAKGFIGLVRNANKKIMPNIFMKEGNEVYVCLNDKFHQLNDDEIVMHNNQLLLVTTKSNSAEHLARLDLR
jgi:hypothetical protein